MPSLLLLPLRRLTSFGLVGASVAIYGLLALYGLVHGLRVQQNVAYLVQAISSIELNFAANARYTWGDRRAPADRARLGRQWLRFHAAKTGTVLCNQALFSLLVLLHLHYLLAWTACTGLTTLVNYFANDRFVFATGEMVA